MMVERGKIHRSGIFTACREQLAATNTDNRDSWHEHVELSASTRVDDLSIPQCKDVFDVLHAAMKASGQPNPIPTDDQIESFLRLVLDHVKVRLQHGVTSTPWDQNFEPNVTEVVGVIKNSRERVYGHLDFIGGSEMRYSLSLCGDVWRDGQLTTISPNDVQFKYEDPTQWMSQLIRVARNKVFRYICNSNLLIAIKTARWCINVRLLCKEPYVPSLKHYLSLAGVHARPFFRFSEFIHAHPFLAMICVERPRTVFDELSDHPDMSFNMMQKFQYKAEEAESNVPDNSRSFGNGLESIVEAVEEENLYEEGEDTCTEEEDTHEDGGYEYEDEGFDHEDEGFDY
ncbi:unnamed protein product [Clonostachys solani]|uniref:Uncharacterized protein n=1 Tax=Clonostachys solani TaxID=160281 RepID=A0A9N9Z1J7_9HYPO|nr:unnamed protein product [Clonostachys solani]